MKDFIIWWNNRYPYDKLWRDKFNVPFNSLTHRAMNPIDIAFEMKENKMFQEYINNEKAFQDQKKTYEDTGKWFIGGLSKNQEDELIDKVDLSQFDD